MATLLLRFPGGRYHATPWGHHVNEGLVEWPPSPWRVLRALIAVGYATCGWTEIPPDGRLLLQTLASRLPSYRLPPASLAQSRHYMPLTVLDKGREKTTLVFDTWARVGDGALAITWDVPLTAGCEALLATLAANLGYLGRSESWVEARLLEPGKSLPEGVEIWPDEAGRRVGREWESIALLAPEPPAVYDAWRAEQVSAALQSFLLPEGRKPSAKLLKERAKAEAPWPTDLLACLQMDSSESQRHGWSLPPGSRRVVYWRPMDALEVGPPRAIRGTGETPPVEAMLLSLSTPTLNQHALPSRTRCLPQAELLHRAAVGLLGREGAILLAPELVGRDAQRRPLAGHRHAHILPLDLDGDEHLEHILIWAPMGLGGAAQEAIRALRRTSTRGLKTELRVAVAGAGSLEMLRRLPEPLGTGMDRVLGGVTGGRTWVSLTPFVPPRFLKPRGANTLEGQVQAELQCRGLPEAEVARLEPDLEQKARLRHFVRVRKQGRLPPPVDLSFGLRITFAEPVPGPLCLGYGSHFGLGMFGRVGE